MTRFDRPVTLSAWQNVPGTVGWIGRTVLANMPQQGNSSEPVGGAVIEDDDKALFRRAVEGARPLPENRRVASDRRKPPPRARFSRADEAAALDESLEADIDALESWSGDALRFSRPGVGRRTLRRLSRGAYAVQGEIDLHGMTVAEARPRLQDFIAHAASSDKRCVRIIHGKGLGSGTRGAVLKPSVNAWLRRMPQVLAFVSARQVDGGTGAVYVLLERD